MSKNGSELTDGSWCRGQGLLKITAIWCDLVRFGAIWCDGADERRGASGLDRSVICYWDMEWRLGRSSGVRARGIYSFEHEATLQQEDAHGLLVEAIFY